MRFGPPVGFARRPDGRKLAYQVLGDADLDLIFVSGCATHLGLLWEDPSVAGFLHKLAAFSRLILLDRLGSGLSDRGPRGQSFEEDMDDVRLVLDAVGSERTALFGTHLGGRLAPHEVAVASSTAPGATSPRHDSRLQPTTDSADGQRIRCEPVAVGRARRGRQDPRAMPIALGQPLGRALVGAAPITLVSSASIRAW
jgi:hypothetical protein